uniref:Protein-PII uridylyltransferase N-terminal domain-containing protein n=1 Tax=Branchiostoma floridae TaxID=7739 RepID=C3YTV9_BRAFL|eukprot:XP_002600224.1 hypothetical protein BRAFLDRAFT_66729 [Branchiostoma floridae]
MDTTSGVAASSAIQPSGNNEIRRNKETSTYAELHLAGDTALQTGDLDAAEGHFASALKEIHDRQSPRVREEEECLRKLGTVYVRRGEQTKDGQDFAKATALFNAALARNGDKDLLIDSIKEGEQLFLYHTVGVDCKHSPYETDIEHKKRLEEFRAEVKARLETIHNDFNPYQYDEDDPVVKEVEMKRAESIRDLFKDISKQRKYFIKDLVEECIKTIGQPPCRYAMAGLGSQATELVTPYSDLEFAILIEENKDTPGSRQYFLNLSSFLYLKIINLGETILPAVGIKSLNDFYSEDPADDWFYDSVTPRGFAFDGAMPWASKTPFGRKGTFMRPPFSLIQTPSGLAELQRHVDETLRHLSGTLMHVSFLKGDQTLVDDYKSKVKRFYQTSYLRLTKVLNTLFEHGETTVPVLTSLHELYPRLWSNTYWQPTGNLLNVKKDIYRFPMVAVVSVGLLGGVYVTSIWDAIQEMKEASVVTEENAHHLQVLVSISGELRLRTYLELGGQKENFSGLVAMRAQQDEGSETLIKSVFHVPDQKMLFRYHYTAHPLKTNIIGLNHIPMGELSTTHLGRRVTFYDASPSVKADICQGLLLFSAAITHTEDALRKLDVDKGATTWLPCQSQEVKLNSRISLLGQQAASYSRLGDHRKALSFSEEQLKEQQKLCRYDPKVFLVYLIIGMARNRIGDMENAFANLQQGWALIPDKAAVFMGPEMTALMFDVMADIRMAWRSDNLDISRLTGTMGSDVEKMVNTFKARYKDFHPMRGIIADLLQYLGELSNLTDDYTKAITYTEESLKIKKTIYGHDTAHPDIAASLTNLGISLCRGVNDHIKAIHYHEEALEMYKVVYGSDTPHPATADILHNLGIECVHIGELKKARSYYEQALRILAAIHGGDEACHPDIAHVFRNLEWLCDDDVDTNSIGNSSSNLTAVYGDHPNDIQLYEDTLNMLVITKSGKEKYPDVVVVLRNLKKICNKLENYDKAIRYQEKELALRKAIHGQDTAHPNIAKSLTNLGRSLCCDLSDHAKAVGCYKEALKINKVLYGNDTPHPDTIGSLTNLAVEWKHLGDLQKARTCYEQALQMTKTIHGAEEARHPDIANILNGLGCVWDDAGDNEKARALWEKALKMYQDIYGPTTPHHDTAVVLHNMGIALGKSGNYFKAISSYEEALKMTEEVLGNTKHPDIALLLGTLGSACHEAGKYTKSLQYHERALEINKAFHGQEAAHPSIAESLCNLAEAHKELGDHTKAAQLYEEALNMTKIIHGANETHGEDEVRHSDIADILNELGCLWYNVGDNAKARSSFEQALKMYQELYGPTTPHHDTAMVLTNMTLACHKARENQKSLQYCERALEIIKGLDTKDSGNPDIAGYLRRLATVYEDHGNYTKAAHLYEDALNMLKTIYGANKTGGDDDPRHPDIADILNSFGSLWDDAGNNEKATAFWEQALKMYQELHGPNNPHRDTAIALNNMGEAVRKSGDYIKAISIYEEALKMTEEVFGESTEHSDIVCVLGNLGLTFHKAGELTKSIQYCERALKMIEGIHGEDAAHPVITEALRDIATVYEDLEDYTKAIKLYEDALGRVRTFRGANKTHRDILKLLSNLETVCNKAGDREKAIGYHEQAQALKTAVEVQEEDHDIKQP